MTIAVAPALNLSGSTDFDPNKFADLMASELGHANGIRVIPVSRVLAILALEGSGGVESPDHALRLVRTLGVDAILVFAVTEYDPYNPPSIGLTVELFGTRPDARDRALDPVALERQASLAADATQARQREPGSLAQVQRMFDASHEEVVRGIRRYARVRDADSSPFGWRKHVVSQRHFIRYCCHATLKTLLNVLGGKQHLAAGPREVWTPWA